MGICMCGVVIGCDDVDFISDFDRFRAVNLAR